MKEAGTVQYEKSQKIRKVLCESHGPKYNSWGCCPVSGSVASSSISRSWFGGGVTMSPLPSLCSTMPFAVTLSRQVVSNSSVTPWTVARQAPRSWNSPGKNTGVGSHSFSWGSSRLRGWIWVSCIASRSFTLRARRGALKMPLGRQHSGAEPGWDRWQGSERHRALRKRWTLVSALTWKTLEVMHLPFDCREKMTACET